MITRPSNSGLQLNCSCSSRFLLQTISKVAVLLVVNESMPLIYHKYMQGLYTYYIDIYVESPRLDHHWKLKYQKIYLDIYSKKKSPRQFPTVTRSSIVFPETTLKITTTSNAVKPRPHPPQDLERKHNGYHKGDW